METVVAVLIKKLYSSTNNQQLMVGGAHSMETVP